MTHPVRGKRPNAWGLYDVYGNVCEWCQDWYEKEYYSNSPTDDPTGPPGGSDRVNRGGSWFAPAEHCRSACRYYCVPGLHNCYVGFRVTLILPENPDGPATIRSTEYSVPGTQSSPSIVPKADSKSQISDLKSEIPPLAVAPFDEKKANEHQEGWAKHLGVPVEITNSIGMKLVLIPPGEFQMGSTPEGVTRALDESKQQATDKYYFEHVRSESPRHRARITNAFCLGMYQVTQGEYEKVMGVNPSAFTGKQVDDAFFKPPLAGEDVKFRLDARKKMAGMDTSRHPVETVSWDEATEFCRRLSAMPDERAARRVYRLPTEAEWEYACRAGTTTCWYCGDEEASLLERAWFGKNSGWTTHAVGGKKPNAWGLYDMHGNVWQLCQDRYDKDYYSKSATDDPAGPPRGWTHVLRGGDWSKPTCYCRLAFRNDKTPVRRDGDSGFRVFLVLPDTAADRAKRSRTTDAAQPSGSAAAPGSDSKSQGTGERKGSGNERGNERGQRKRRSKPAWSSG